MSKHTPGPWIIGGIESGMMSVDGSNGGEVTGFVISADARLIAAAPDLLEALRLTRGQWIHSVNAEVCLAAIEKATGERI